MTITKKKKSTKKRTRKSVDSLNKSKIPKVRHELVDADYLDRIKHTHPEAYEYYAKFIDEYVGANIKKSKKTNAPLARHLHRSNALAKSVYDANNRRNNDVLGVTKINGLLWRIGSGDGDFTSVGGFGELGKLNNPGLIEDAMIAIIDQRDYLPENDDDSDDSTDDSNNK